MGKSDNQLTGSEEEEMAFLEGYAPAEEHEADWQHITTDSDAGSDYSTLTEGSASSDNILSLENQSQLAEIAKKTQEELKKRNIKRKFSMGPQEDHERPAKKKKKKSKRSKESSKRGFDKFKKRYKA